MKQSSIWSPWAVQRLCHKAISLLSLLLLLLLKYSWFTKCVTFFCTAEMIQLYIYMYSFPLWLITGYWIQFPGLYSRTLLFIYFIYSSLYLLTQTPNSTHPPTTTSPFGNHTFAFYVWVCFSFVEKFICVIFQIPHISDIIWCLSLSDLLHLVW